MTGLGRWWRRIWSDHGDGTNHAWLKGFGNGHIFKCGVCGEVDFGEPRID